MGASKSIFVVAILLLSYKYKTSATIDIGESLILWAFSSNLKGFKFLISILLNKPNNLYFLSNSTYPLGISIIK